MNKFKVIFMAIIFFTMGITLVNLVSSRAQAEVQMEVYNVKPGDTLWHIAGSRIDDSVDIRDKIDEIRMDNKINADIKVGQKLKLRKIN